MEGGEPIFKMLSAWADQAEKLRNSEISKDQYDRWRYTFPAEDATQRWAKVPSWELSDMLVEALKADKDESPAFKNTWQLDLIVSYGGI